MTLGRFTIRDVPRNNGVLNVTGVITRSSNVGAAKVAAKMPDQVFYDGVRRFGYGSVPHSGFPVNPAAWCCARRAGRVPPRPRCPTATA